jgi:hypothetical protein
VLIIILIVVFVFVNPRGGSIPEPPPPLSPEERYDLYYGHLLGIGYNSSILDDASSPQAQALTWISMTDTLYENPRNLKPSETLEKMNKRFFLVVFYFTMTQTGPWVYCSPPETGESNACVHENNDAAFGVEGVGVEGVYFPQRERQPTFRWLSPLDECKWAGVQCLDGDFISQLRLGKSLFAKQAAFCYTFSN